MSVKKEQI